jgi:hypothetical protein
LGVTTGPKAYCSICGTEHRRKHLWCKLCFNEWVLGGRPHRSGGIGTPPPPPPGFDPRDLAIGKPLL